MLSLATYCGETSSLPIRTPRRATTTGVAARLNAIRCNDKHLPSAAQRGARCRQRGLSTWAMIARVQWTELLGKPHPTQPLKQARKSVRPRSLKPSAGNLRTISGTAKIGGCGEACGQRRRDEGAWNMPGQSSVDAGRPAVRVFVSSPGDVAPRSVVFGQRPSNSDFKSETSYVIVLVLF